MKKVAVIILNYNGSKDTVECIDSIVHNEGDRYPFSIFVFDNASNIEEKKILKEYIDNTDVCFSGDYLDFISINSFENGLYCIWNKQNLGFAGGNNACICVAVKNEFDYCILLNNDTLLCEPSITMLCDVASNNPQYMLLSSIIYYWDNKEEVWNAGGKIGGGSRKYYLNSQVHMWKTRGIRIASVSFLTGCFILIKREFFDKYGILSDKFFFGEEDYELALRCRKNHVKMAVFLGTKIYHKVGRSISCISDKQLIAKGFVHRLNRNVNMKAYYGKFTWAIWHYLGLIKFFVELLFLTGSVYKAFNYTVNLHNFSIKYDRISYDLFTWIINSDMTLSHNPSIS